MAIIEGRGELDPEATAYPMFLQPARPINGDGRHCMFFHFAMWLSANPTVNNFRMVVDGSITQSPVVQLSGHPLVVLFGRRRDRTAFQRWLKRYQKWFGAYEVEHNYLPELPENGSLRLNIVNTPFARTDFMSPDSFPDGFAERWSWVITNCKTPVYLLPNRGFGFRSLNDAVHFKLAFGV